MRLRALGALLCIAVGIAPLMVGAQESDFLGEWLLDLETGNQAGMRAVGTLAIEEGEEGLELYVDGGPVNLLELDGNRIVFDLDWSGLGDSRHVSIFEGELNDGVMEGTSTENGESRGAWRATPYQPRPRGFGSFSDIAGIWGSPGLLSKWAFDLTEEGVANNAMYDSTIDDPILRCVSDGLIRMLHGPFDIEVVVTDNRVIVLHEDLHQIRRIYTDGRGFPEGIDEADLSMGYSLGRFEDGTLIVETRGLKRGVWDAAGMPISAGSRITERWWVDDDGLLHIELALFDSVNYHRPALMHQIRSREPDDAEIREYSCDPHAFYRSLDLEERLEEYWSRSENRL